MQNPFHVLQGDPATALLLIGDHASNHVPSGIDLGIAATLLNTHIAIDLGVAALAARLTCVMGCTSILGGVSRLVVDLNREEDAAHIIRTSSDGHVVPGNVLNAVERAGRIDAFWRPYHHHIAAHIAAHRPKLLISLHSFTPKLETQPDADRPWEVGVLYNQDDRAARIAIPLLSGAGVIVGDQQPYSGVHLNATMNRHGEANGIAYLGLEMRQDLIATDADVERWADVLAPVITACCGA
jgi:predicted N-formylglutamate amidohydrolase